jgi:hypothetical protein
VGSVEAGSMSDFVYGILIVFAVCLSALIGFGLWLAAMVLV